MTVQTDHDVVATEYDLTQVSVTSRCQDADKARRDLQAFNGFARRGAPESVLAYQAETEELEQRLRDGVPFDDLEGPDEIRARIAALGDT